MTPASTRHAGPSATTIGWLSVLFGAGYLALSRLFDKRHLVGTATPFVVAGHVALITGIIALADDLGTAGVGIALVVAGVLVARLGAVGGRRVTTIIGAVEIGLGALLVLGDAMEDASATSFGTALFVLGAAVAGLAQVLHMSTGEPPQTTPGPSSFPGWSQAGKRVSTTPAGTAAGPWAGPPAVAPPDPGRDRPPAAPPDPGPGRRSPPSRGPHRPRAGLRSRARRRPRSRGSRRRSPRLRRPRHPSRPPRHRRPRHPQRPPRHRRPRHPNRPPRRRRRLLRHPPPNRPPRNRPTEQPPTEGPPSGGPTPPS